MLTRDNPILPSRGTFQLSSSEQSLGQKAICQVSGLSRPQNGPRMGEWGPLLFLVDPDTEV